MRMLFPVLCAVLCLSLSSLAEAPKDAFAKGPARSQRKSRLDLASSGWTLSLGRYKAGAAGIEDLLLWSQRLFDAERATDAKLALSHRLTRLTELEDAVTGRVNGGTATQLDLFAVQYQLATAQGE